MNPESRLFGSPVVTYIFFDDHFFDVISEIHYSYNDEQCSEEAKWLQQVLYYWEDIES